MFDGNERDLAVAIQFGARMFEWGRIFGHRD